MKKILKYLLGVSLIGICVFSYVYFGIFEKKINTGKKDFVYFYIRSSDGFEEVVESLAKEKIVESADQFAWLAELRHLNGNIYPGRYTLSKDLNYSDLVVYLRSGQIDEVTVTFNNVRTLDQLAEKVATQIEASEKELKDLLNDPSFIREYGYTKETFLSVFIPNTYLMYWNTSAKVFVDRMVKEHQKWWNEERLKKAKKLKMTPVEVSTLASIVLSEQNKIASEWPLIAGLYINRLNAGMLLQSDPTVVFACGDFSIRRVLNKHLEIDSKYNTYKYTGLPPGPIRVPNAEVIDAVLNYTKTDYYYMCASPDGSGLHWFAKNYAGHLENARKYHQYLNKKKIY